MTLWTDIDQMIAEMVRDGYDPGAIIGSPVQIKRLLAQFPKPDVLYAGETVLSGWVYKGLPIARSYEVSGPCVVSREVYGALKKCGRVRYPDGGQSALAASIALATEDPILF